MMGKKHKKNQKQRPKKEKITWVDDGSTVVDMSDVGRGLGGSRKNKNPNITPPLAPKRNKGELLPRGCLGTYLGAVRMMFAPMLVVIGILCAVFLLLWLILGALSPSLMV